MIENSVTKGINPKVFDKARKTKIISSHGKRIEDGNQLPKKFSSKRL